MERDPFALDYHQLDRPEVVYRIREGGYRIVFEPGPGHREVTVVRIGHQGSVYEGLKTQSANGEGCSGGQSRAGSASPAPAFTADTVVVAILAGVVSGTATIRSLAGVAGAARRGT